MISRLTHPIKMRIRSAMFYKIPHPPKDPALMTIPEIMKYNELPTLKAYDKWWCYTWILMFPATVFAAVYSFWTEYEHYYGAHAHPPAPYIPYEILEQATVLPFNKGRSLFFNARYNTLPGVGYLWRDDYAQWEKNEEIRAAAAADEDEEEEEEDDE